MVIAPKYQARKQEKKREYGWVLGEEGGTLTTGMVQVSQQDVAPYEKWRAPSFRPTCFRPIHFVQYY